VRPAANVADIAEEHVVDCGCTGSSSMRTRTCMLR
jgi:hypothetical protein